MIYGNLMTYYRHADNLITSTIWSRLTHKHVVINCHSNYKDRPEKKVTLRDKTMDNKLMYIFDDVYETYS